MAHASDIRKCEGVDSPHAFTNIPLCERRGALDKVCPNCQGHGQWNREIDLVSFRSKREICQECLGSGWIETGDDALAIPDIVLSPEGHPRWITRYLPQRNSG